MSKQAMQQARSDPFTAFAKSRMPIYAQVASLLKQRIASGRWGPGERLPNLDTLQEEFSIARITARQAVGMLEEEGLVWRKQGKGTFVALNLPDQRWLKVGTDWASLMSTIEGTALQVLERAHASAPPDLALSEGRPADGYQRLRRVHAHHDNPYCVIDLYIADHIYALRPEDFENRLAMQVIAGLCEEGLLTISAARQSLVIGRGDIETAERLDIEIGAPVAVVRRILTDAGGTNIYYAEITYRGDFIKLDFDLLTQPNNQTREDFS